MELVTGPFRPALEGAFAEAFAALRKGDPLAPLAVVAPSKRLADRLKEIALAAVPGGFAAVRFFNLFSFARTLYDEAAPDARLVLDDLLPSGVVRGLLERHFKEERYLSRAALAPAAILGALHELKAAAVNPDHALALLVSEELGYEDAPKLAEILSLYKRYAEELRRRRVHERSDAVRLAAEHAPRSKWLGTLKHVLYYGFYELDQNQLDLLREVVRRVPATIFFPYLERPEYAFAKDFLKTLVAPLAKGVRALPAEAPTPRVTRVATSGAHDEVWAAAKEIVRLADRGVPFDAIGVVARTLDPYVHFVDSLFREHHIPFTSSAQRRLDRDPAIKSARLLFTLDDFNRADVMDLLRSPYFRREGGEPELWDRASRLMGIGRGAEEWRRRLGSAAGKDWRKDQGERGDPLRFVLPRAEVDLFWASVRALLDAPPPPRGWKDFSAWALERQRTFLKPDPRAEGVIESLGALEGMAAEDPRGALLDLLASLAEPVGGPAGVRVLDAMAARGLPSQALIILGMNERVFPRFILEDPFVRDAVRSRFEHRLGCRMPRKLEGYEEERMLFALLMGSADEVVLIHQRSDERGRPQSPSVLIPKGEVRQVARRPAERLAAEPLEILTPREAALRTGQAEALGRARGLDVGLLVHALDFLHEIESRGAPTRYDGLIEASGYFNAAASHGLSPTSLEKLAECPFKYFASKVLDLEELEEPEGEESITPIEIGNIYHAALEKFHQGKPLDRALEAACAALEEDRTIRYPVLWEVQKERMAKTLKAFVDADDLSVFKPRGCEVKLSSELPVEAGGRRTVRFTGYVDRLDVGPGGSFRAVDYKKSRGKYKAAMETGVFKRGWLQAPLYFLLAERSLGKVDVARSKFVYSFLEEALEGEKWELALEGDFWERRAEFDALLRGMLETIAQGRFFINPGEACRNCSFGTMCRKSHLPTRWRAHEARGS